jgi:hypothetical protein
MNSNIQARKEAVKKLLNGDNLIIVLVLLATIFLKIYYFFKVGAQPIWWDEGDYLSIAKYWVLDIPLSEGMSYLLGMRPFLLSILQAAILKVGLGELTIRFFLELLPSILSVYVMYLLVKDMYGKWAGVSASVMTSFYWVWQFYTYRIMTDVPSTFFAILSIYFLMSWYEKSSKPSGLYLAVLFGVLSFSMRFPQALILMTSFAYLLITRKLSLFKDRVFWKAAGLLVLLLVPYFIYLVAVDFAPLATYFGSTSTTATQSINLLLIFRPVSWMYWPWIILLVFGFVKSLTFLMGLDVVWKQKDKSLNNDLYLLLWLASQIFFYIFIIKVFEDRWVLMLSMCLFVIASKGFSFIEEFGNKYYKWLGIGVALVLLLMGAYYNHSHASELIISKSSSYGAVKDAGLWIRDNSVPADAVMTASVVQNYYYSERASHNLQPSHKDIPLNSECRDTMQNILNTPECSRLSEKSFNNKVEQFNPKFLVLSIYEPSSTPGWIINYPLKNNMSVVWLDNPQQPTLIIYQFPQNFVPVSL